MRMKHNGLTRLLAGAVTTFALVACTPGVKPPSEADIRSAQDAGTLNSLYSDVSDRAARAPGNKQLQASRKHIARLLALSQYSGFQSALDSGRSDTGWVGKQRLVQLSSMLTPLQDLDPSLYSQGMELLQQEEQNRQAREETLRSRIDATPSGEIATSLTLIDQLADLTGASDGYPEMRQQRMAAASSYANERLAEGDLAAAIATLMALQEAAPGDPDISRRIADIDMQQHLQEVNALKESGEVDQAFTQLMEMLDKPETTPFHSEITPLLYELSEYYNLVAQSALTEENWLQAYQHLRRANLASSRLDEFYLDPTPTQDFISQMLLLASDARQQRPGLALGYLLAIRELAPDLRELEPQLLDVKDRLYEEGVVKVATSTFDSPPGAPGLGGVLTARIMQLLADMTRTDIRLLERSSLDEILKEQEIMSLTDDVDVTISSADFLVQGALLESTVDTSVQPNKQTRRVVIDNRKVANPAYQQWSTLSPEKRRQQPAPPAYVDEAIRETITFTITEHRKDASMTSAFRVINPSTSKLLHTETLVTEQSFEDTSQEGIDIGLFVQEVKQARLPADSRILRELADQQAKEIATRLFERFRDPERQYLARSESFAHEGDFDEAAEQLAMAVVLRERKSLDFDDLTHTLRQYALRAR